MTWKPNLNDADVTKEGGILMRAYRLFQPCHIQNKLCDDDGMFALDTDSGVLCARKYVYGDIVSCHERAAISAMNQKKSLIMYIRDAKAFYKFNPKEIFDEGDRNMRGSSPMINFPVKMGVRI